MATFSFPEMLLLSLVMGSFIAASAGDFHQEFELTWGDERAQILDGGKLLTLTLDKTSGSGFRSKSEYLFGRIDMQIKLVSGNSAGTVTAFYLSSEGPNHDEIDFEFLGNLSGDPYILHTNVYSQGKGDREQQFYLWFDPTKNFHTYSIVWNLQRIIYMVDNIPIRVFNNEESFGVPFPKNQPMKLYSSLWNADQWATRGGLVKTDWSKAPFKAYFRNFNANACVWSNGESDCASKTSGSLRNNVLRTQALDASGRRRLRWVQKYFMVYNYCTDLKRFPLGRPREFVGSIIAAFANNFHQDVEITWGGSHAQILGRRGNLLTLTMDKTSGGAGFESTKDFLFGRFNMQMKLIAGNSAGTVTTFYLSSEGPSHDEIDLEFLGNKSGAPYTLHTNVFSHGQGGREEEFHLWFDPTKHFHAYSIVWNPQNIIILVDNIPIRAFSNQESIGVPYPNHQRMKVYASLWDADDWATRGGRVKTDWSKAPFTACYRNFVASNAWEMQGLSARGRKLLTWVQKRYRIYNYCNDLKRNQRHGRPPECSHGPSEQHER